MPKALSIWLESHLRVLTLMALTLVAYIAAINRHQSLPWFIAATLLAALIVGLAWPHWLVARLSVTRSGPARAEEGESISFEFVVSNHGLLPRFMIELTDRLPFLGAATGTPQAGPCRLGVVTYLAGRKARQLRIAIACEKRGYYRLGPVGLISSFPLGFAEARQERRDGLQDLTVYPNIFPIVDLVLRGAPSQIHRGGYLLPEGSGAAEFCGLREYRRGDNPRHIHWPTTARMNELMVRQFEPLASACICLALDLSSAGNVGPGKHATLEYAVRIAGSIARFACLKNIRTRMFGMGTRRVEISPGSGALQYQRILDELAVVGGDGSIPYARVLDEVATRALTGETIVVFLSPPASESAAILDALQLLRGKRAHIYAVLFDRAGFESAPGRGEAATQALLAAVRELDAQCVQVARGDDLIALFNP